MSLAHDIDNGEPEPLFLFDSNESLKSLNHLEVCVREPQSLSSCVVDRMDQSPTLKSSTSSRREQSTPEEMADIHISDYKGKGVSQPMSIQTREVLESLSLESSDDLFSFDSPAHVRERIPSLSLPSSSGDPQTTTHVCLVEDGTTVGESAARTSGKGKGREVPPRLPPLSFYTTELNYESSDWPTFEFSPSVPGPFSYGSGYESIADPDRSPSVVAADHLSSAAEIMGGSAPLMRVPSRRRSLSNLSIHSKRSISALSITKLKVKLSSPKGPTNLARKFFKKRVSAPGSPTTSDGGDIIIDTDVPGCVDSAQGNCFAPWACDVKYRMSPVTPPTLEAELGYGSLEPALSFCIAGRPSDNAQLRTKGRSYSSPLPLPSTPLDLIPVTTVDIFPPLPAVRPDYFDEFLPSELKLHVFACLVELYETEHQKRIQEGRWSVRKAGSSKNRWVGRERGVRELFKLSRVSRSWRALVFDGQLWMKLNLRSFPQLPSVVLAQLSDTAGGFIRHVHLAGHTSISASTLLYITNNLCVGQSQMGDPYHTHLTTINLKGCSALTTHSLHDLLRRSPSLRHLCLQGLSAVTNTTCSTLAVHCSKLISLNLSRCPNMDGNGIYSLVSSTLARDKYLPLKELRLCGLRGVTDKVIASLGKAVLDLEVLDLSYSRDLHNSAIEAFVACSENEATDFETVRLTSREAGRDPTDTTTYGRRVTRLRHLSLSSCLMLTDHACSHLAHAVPKLEFLELAGIGADLRDDGLVRLLETTPYIRRLDLEDACEITDDLLFAITPDPVTDGPPHRISIPPQPGHALEHLTISYASEVTNEAMLDLIRNCTRLRVLEADNTRMSGAVVKEFVRISRERKLKDAQVVAIDCRGVGEQTVKDLNDETRPRIGWRSYEARKLGFLDGRDDEELGVGQDECDEQRVALKTFYCWQTVDAVRAAREKKRKNSKRGANVSSSSGTDEFAGTSIRRARWWSPGGRRLGETSPINMVDLNNDREGCTIM